MRKVVYCFLIIAICCISIFSQKTGDTPGWNFEMQVNTNARSNITVQNRCQNTHSFRIQPKKVPFLEISQLQVSVGGGSNVEVPVVFNTANLKTKTYRGDVLVICETCSSEPTCSQDREKLTVVMKVSAPPNSNSKKKPCKDLKNRCDELLATWQKATSTAVNLQTTANEESKKANKADDEATKAEEKAMIAGEAAKDEESAYRAKVNDKEFHSNDIAYMELMRAANLADWQNGRISSDEYQKRANAITPSKAREERLKNKKRLKKEAEKAGKEAATKRKVANKAKAEAESAQKKADEAKTKAEAARKAYEDCIKKIKEECDKIKAEAAKAAAEQKKREAAEEKAKQEQERLRIAEQNRKDAEERKKKIDKERNEYLLDNIKTLGLVDSRLIKQVPGLWDILPLLSELDKIQMGLIAEGITQAPIPVDAITVIGRLAGILGQMYDPCSGAAKLKIIGRVQTLTNPYTGKKYTWGEALKKTEGMCNLLNDIRGKLAVIKKAQQKRK